jgi:alanyl-tRNA synthetase
VRRIEALTGNGARDHLKRYGKRLRDVAAELEVPPERAVEEIASLRQQLKERERELSQLRLRLISGGGDDEGTVLVDGVKVVAREVPPAPNNEIRNMADVLKAKVGSGVVVLASRDDDKVTLITAVSEELTGRVHAGRLTREIAGRVGGTGGGRADFAQGGGKQPDRLSEALEAVPKMVGAMLKG